MASKYVNEFCEIIESYGGRDKVMKVLCYSAKLVAGYHKSRNLDLSKRYSIISSRISSARATLRLIDDVPMIQYALEYGFGHKESDSLMAILGVSANVVDILYYPVEKICWLAEHKVINIKNADNWEVINSMFWTVSIYLNLMRTLRNFLINRKKFKNTVNTNSDGKALKKQHLELISIVRLSLDLLHAASTLPPGFLCGGKLSTFQVGAIGTLSACLGIYQIITKRQMLK